MATTQGRLDGTDICNLALAHLGLPAIGTAEYITPTTKSGIIIKQYYRPTRDTLLREHPWKHSTINVKLAITYQATPLAAGAWEYIYNYPTPNASGPLLGAQIIRKIFTDTNSKNPDPIEYRLFQGIQTDGELAKTLTLIATNEADAYAEITLMGYDDDNAAEDNPGQYPGVYDSLFVMAWSYLIAAMAAVVLTGDRQKAEDMAKWHAVFLDKAKLADTRETNIDTYAARHQSAFVDTR